MKQKRARLIPREGPPCRRCGRATQLRTNWPRALEMMPGTERFNSRFHHLCRRCFRKVRPNDRGAGEFHQQRRPRHGLDRNDERRLEHEG